MSFIPSAGVWVHEIGEEAICRRCEGPAALMVSEAPPAVAEGPWCSLTCWGAYHDERARITGHLPPPTNVPIPPWPGVRARMDLTGPPGITCTRDHLGHVLTYRDGDGILAGVLWRRNGAIAVVVDPDRRRHGIGRALVRAAGRRWHINLGAAPVTAAGAALTSAALPPEHP